jgi:serine/threonine protein kinase
MSVERKQAMRRALVTQKYGTGNPASMLGRGAYGTVFKTDKGYAEKYMEDDVDDEDIVGSNIVELIFLSKLKSKAEKYNVMQLLDFYFTPTATVFVLPFASASLADFNWSTMLRFTHYCTDILTGLAYIHSHCIYHRDLKESNCLLVDGRVMISDFGSACFAETKIARSDRVGTNIYRAPELLLGDIQYDQSIDIWAFGVMVYNQFAPNDENFLSIKQDDNSKIATATIDKIYQVLGKPREDSWPGCSFYIKSMRSEYDKRRGDPEINKITNVIVRNFISKALAYPANRLSAHELLRHQLFNNNHVEVAMSCQEFVDYRLPMLDSDGERRVKYLTETSNNIKQTLYDDDIVNLMHIYCYLLITDYIDDIKEYSDILTAVLADVAIYCLRGQTALEYGISLYSLNAKRYTWCMKFILSAIADKILITPATRLVKGADKRQAVLILHESPRLCSGLTQREIANAVDMWFDQDPSLADEYRDYLNDRFKVFS